MSDILTYVLTGDLNERQELEMHIEPKVLYVSTSMLGEIRIHVECDTRDRVEKHTFYVFESGTCIRDHIPDYLALEHVGSTELVNGPTVHVYMVGVLSIT